VLKLLLDEHISPAVATDLRRRNRSIIVYGMAEWERGEFLGQDDSTILWQAFRRGLTLVTYDRRTIPPLLKSWAETGQSHGGVIFVDDRSISPADIGGLMRALYKAAGRWDWTDRVCFLRR
jgi:hypothetical protein